jgi:hypothetical protein
MALYGTLQLSHSLGLCRNQRFCNPENSAMRRRLHISNGPLSLGVPVIFQTKFTLAFQIRLLIVSNITFLLIVGTTWFQQHITLKLPS